MPLTMIGIGGSAVVQRIQGKDDTRRFLYNLGFTEGGEITVVSTVNGDLIVNVRGARIALSRHMASRVIVS